MRSFEETWFRSSGVLRLGGKLYRGEWGVWLEMAQALPGQERVIPKEGGRKYDWQGRKLAYRLSGEDLGKIGFALEHLQPGELVALVHRYQGKQKTLQMVMASNGVLFVNGQGEGFKVSVPLDGEGIWRLRRCIAIAYEETICQRTKPGRGSADPAT